MTSVSDMVNNFLQAEEKNFSLFNFVNELNRCTPQAQYAHNETLLRRNVLPQESRKNKKQRAKGGYQSTVPRVFLLHDIGPEKADVGLGY